MRRFAASKLVTGFVLNAIAACGAWRRIRSITSSKSSTSSSGFRMPPPTTTTPYGFACRASAMIVRAACVDLNEAGVDVDACVDKAFVPDRDSELDGCGIEAWNFARIETDQETGAMRPCYPAHGSVRFTESAKAGRVPVRGAICGPTPGVRWRVFRVRLAWAMADKSGRSAAW